MKLATFRADGAPELGIVDGERMICLTRSAPGLAQNMIELIQRWGKIEHEVRGIAKAPLHVMELSKVKLMAPIPRPGKIMAIGLNYADHIEETKATKPDKQIWFSKMPTAVNGPYDPIQIPKVSSAVDWEAE